MRNRITVKDLDRWGACCRDDGGRYSNENLKKLMKNKASISVDEALKLKIPVVDKLWLMLRPELIPEKTLYKLGHVFVRRVVKKYCLNCGVAEFEVWAKEYLELDLDKLYKDENARFLAWVTAWIVADHAFDLPARSAPWSIAWAARSAPWSIAWAAPYANWSAAEAVGEAAWSAIQSAAWDEFARVVPKFVVEDAWNDNEVNPCTNENGAAERKWQLKQIKKIRRV